MQKLKVERPWGKFEQFTHNEPTTVKLLTIKDGEEFSLQYHKNRTEFWRIISGTPEITLGDKKINAVVGDEFEVPIETKHRIHAVNGDVEVLEIAFGNFDEEDLVRIEDKYGRA